MSVRSCASTSAAALLLAASSLHGCAGSDVDANPVYVGRVHEDARGESSRVLSLGPLWDDAKGPDFRETALHPLWRRVETPHETRWQFLEPIFAGRTTNDESSSRFLAFGWSRHHRSESTRSDYDFMLFPLLWFGNGPDSRERYFALFPLGGVIESFAGFAQAGFVLFPLYYWVTKDVSAPETFHNVTPLIGWVNGGPRDGSWHVLPLGAHWQWEGKYEKWSFLWPIFHWQRNRLDTTDPSTEFAVWPLFGLERSERMFFLSFLWPFFRWRTETVESWDEANVRSETVYWHKDAFWPLWRSERTRDYDYLRLFPFFARYRSPELDSDAWAIPFLWLREAREKEWTKSTFDFVPLVHWERKRWNPPAGGGATRADDSAFKLWPLFGVRDEAGAHDVKAPVLLPLDIERYAGDFEANWGPLWELWHTHREADGSTRGNALLRLVDWESRGGRSRFSIPLLYARDATPRRTRHSLLLGLVQFGGGEGGAEFKLLGMPLVTPEVATR